MNLALNRTTTIYLTNKSGGALAQGAVVVVDTSNAGAFTTTTSLGFSTGMIGVVLDPAGIANNASGAVAIAGYVPKILLSSSASLGDLFRTHTVAGQAVRHAAPIVQGDFGMVLATGTAPAAILYGAAPQLVLDASALSYYAPTGLTGATQASRYVGATASGAPASGTFAIGDYIIDRGGKMWICTTAGTPGTWVNIAAAAGGGARVYRSTAQSIPNNTLTAIEFDSELYDSGSYHDTGSNTSRLTVPSGMGGVYIMCGTASWTGADTGFRGLYIRVGGTNYIAASRTVNLGAGANVYQTVSAIYTLADGNYVELIAEQTQGINLNLDSNAHYSPEFAIQKVG